jgi:hypothetical protein
MVGPLKDLGVCIANELHEDVIFNQLYFLAIIMNYDLVFASSLIDLEIVLLTLALCYLVSLNV